MKSDILIAREVKLKPIAEIAEKIGIRDDELELHGKYKAKVELSILQRIKYIRITIVISKRFLLSILSWK